MDLENRIAGFATQNTEKFESANSAYKSFINAIGDDENEPEKPDFKKFLETAKQTGVLDTMLKKTGIKKDTPEEDPMPEKKKFTLNTTQIVGIVLGVAVIGTVIYLATRKKKQPATA